MPPERILVVEDEPGIVDFLARGLSREGYEVETSADGESGLEKAVRRPVDLVILDLMLPGRSGEEVLAELHAVKPDLPVIVLTARAGIDDRVNGLDAGAVDYLVKPFALKELIARVRAHLRFASHATPTVLQAGGLTVDLIRRDATFGGRTVRLSATEFELLVHLMRNPGRALTREQILRSVWGYSHDPSTNVVDVYIGYLRRKLKEAAEGDPIATVRSVGYRFDGFD